ncbi:MAG: TlpA disulfide reductase family protein [Gemmatales bacterium]
MKRFLLSAALLALPGTALLAQEKTKNPPQTKSNDSPQPPAKGELTPQEKFKAAKKAVVAAQNDVNNVTDEIRKRKEQVNLENKEFKAVYDVYQKAAQEARNAAQELVKVDPKSDAGFEAITFPMTIGRPKAEGLKLLAEHHAEKKGISRSLNMLTYGPPSDEAVSLLEKIIGKNPNKLDQAQARFILASLIMKSGESKSYIQMFEELVKDFKDSEDKEVKSIVARAERTLFEIRSLAIGKPVPDIEGEDIEGKRFKLSDYKGKVILLVFWGHWCRPCVAMIPHERSLVKRMEGKPFVLLGVNSDTDRDFIKKMNEERKVSWRFFWCGEEGPSGPIPTKWNISGWPTIYYIDHNGNIAARDIIGEKDMDSIIDKLVEAAEKDQKAGGNK